MKTYEDARSSLRCVPNLLSPVLPKLNLVFQVSIILVRASSEDEKPLLHPANWAANWTANWEPCCQLHIFALLMILLEGISVFSNSVVL